MKFFKIPKIEFQLFYLGFLTKEKIKPLSRWEKRINKNQLRFLEELGLKIDLIPRKVLTGKTVYETIFSMKSRYLKYYKKHFYMKNITHNMDEKKKEGFLFGYPSCCVNNFVYNGYNCSNYIPDEQKIFFHHICPDCRVTPSLKPYYKKIYENCKNEWSYRIEKQKFGSGLIQKAIPIAASLLLGISSTNINADEHWLPVQGDNDNDFLNYPEEILMGTECFYFYPSAADSIAKTFSSIINALPREISETECYAVDNYAYGFYTCPICGETANMGWVSVHNPLRELEIGIPYMTLHFMGHGSFSSIIEGDTLRVNIELLKEILAPFDTEHLIVLTENDNDNDGLNNSAEIYFETNPENQQTHNLGIDDGQEISEAIIEVISDLPKIEIGQTQPTDECYLSFFEGNGVESCIICGGIVSMGFVAIHNPMLETDLGFPIIGLHYMAHGRFAFNGSSNEGEVDPILLATVLEIDLTGVSDIASIAEKYGYKIINFPNPFNPSGAGRSPGTTISFELPVNIENAIIEIFNIKGEKVKTLPIVTPSPSHTLSVTWNGTNDSGKPVSSGIYLYQLKVGNKFSQIRKMLLMK